MIKQVEERFAERELLTTNQIPERSSYASPTRADRVPPTNEYDVIKR